MKALVVGLGRMGTFHCRVLRDLGYDVTTVDPLPGIADYTLPPKRGYAVTCIATPIAYLAEAAAERVSYCDSLLVEKPLAQSAAEARELAGLLRHKDAAVGYVERFNPQVRALAASHASEALFVRWNVRQSPDIGLDLKSHDIDLANRLGLKATYDTRAGADQVRRQIITDKGAFDLCDHDTSPLHAQWHAFLSGRPDYATVDDAIAVLGQLETSRTDLALSAMTPEVQI